VPCRPPNRGSEPGLRIWISVELRLFSGLAPSFLGSNGLARHMTVFKVPPTLHAAI
jgi:hypothetical protein